MLEDRFVVFDRRPNVGIERKTQGPGITSPVLHDRGAVRAQPVGANRVIDIESQVPPANSWRIGNFERDPHGVNRTGKLMAVAPREPFQRNCRHLNPGILQLARASNDTSKSLMPKYDERRTGRHAKRTIRTSLEIGTRVHDMDIRNRLTTPENSPMLRTCEKHTGKAASKTHRAIRPILSRPTQRDAVPTKSKTQQVLAQAVGIVGRLLARP